MHVKKKNKFIIIVLAVIFSFSIPLAALAAAKTNGNIEFEGGKAGIYADDFQYLHGEIEKLFQEITN